MPPIRLFAFCLTLFLILQALPGQAQQLPAQPRQAAEAKPLQVMFLYGSPSHPSGMHEFRAGALLLAKQFNNQDAVPIKTHTHAGWPKDESILDDMDAVVIYADGTKVIRHGWEKMDALVKEGVGVMMIHYAVHPPIKEGEKYFLPWMGGYFENGHSVNPIWAATIKPLDKHAVSQGVEPFTAKGEFYFNLKYAEGMIPLGVATPTKDNLYSINNLWTQTGYEAMGKPQALLWGYDRPAPGQGRGAGFTGGHFHNNWAVDDLRRIVLNTIVWVAGGDVPEGGVPITKVTEEELNANLDKKSKMNHIELPKPCDCEFTPGHLLTPEQHKAGHARRPKG